MIKYGKEARKKLLIGIQKLARAVGSTLGGEGKNVIFENKYEMPSTTRDGVTVAKQINLTNKFEKLGADLVKDAAIQTNTKAGDGPQAFYSKVLTPNGFVKMGSINVGDNICGTNGSTQKVIGVFPRGKKQVFKVKTVDGRVAECSKDHSWSVTTSYGIKKTLTTEQLIKNGLYKINKAGFKKHNYYLPVSKAEFSKKDLPIDPYLIGTLIGDGSLSGTGSVELCIGIKKKFIIDKIKLPKGLRFNVQFVEPKNCFRIKISGKTKQNKTIKDLIAEIGLLGSKSNTKFIPKQYLYSDTKSRKELLQGLSDTDGYINKSGLLEYSTISKQLYLDILELLRGLGKTTYSYLRKRKLNEGSYSQKSIYRISELKGYKYGNPIVDIIPTNKYTEMMCIKVSNSDNLYYTDDYILTHNTTTAIVLTESLISNSFKAIDEGLSPIYIKTELQKRLPIIIADLRKEVQEVKTKEQMIQVAKLSSQDEELGNLIGNIIHKIGKDGVVTVENSNTFGITNETVQGLRIDKGYVAPQMVTDYERMISELKNVHILFVGTKISTLNDIVPLYDKLVKKGISELVIIADDYAEEILGFMIANKIKGFFNTLAIKAPSFGDHRKNLLEDMAILTGGQVFSKEKGMKFEDITIEMLGQSSKIISTKNHTTIVGGIGSKGDQEVIDKRICQIKTELSQATTPFDKEKYQERIARLLGGVSVIKVGVASEVENKEKQYRIEDAVNATKSAIEEGIIEGGGIPLLRIALQLKESSDSIDKILYSALERPFRQIIENGGENPDKIIDIIKNTNRGYDITNRKLGNMFEMGIIDPLKVTRIALENAFSVATIVITTDTLISLPKENIKPINTE